MKTAFEDAGQPLASEQEVEESSMTYKYLHYAPQVAGLQSGGSATHSYVYVDGTPLQESEGTSYPWAYFRVDSGTSSPYSDEKNVKLEGLYYVVFKLPESQRAYYEEIIGYETKTNSVTGQPETDYDKPIYSEDTGWYDVYEYHVPTINTVTKSISWQTKQIRPPETGGSWAEYNEWANTKYKQASAAQYWAYKEGGPCVFPVSTGIGTAFYEFNLTSSTGGVYGTSQTANLQFVLSQNPLELVDLKIGDGIEYVSTADQANSITPTYEEFIDGQGEQSGQAIWSPEYDEFTENDRNMPIWILDYEYEGVSASKFLHWTAGGVQYAIIDNQQHTFEGPYTNGATVVSDLGTVRGTIRPHYE